jgi:hypothetical protein
VKVKSDDLLDTFRYGKWDGATSRGRSNWLKPQGSRNRQTFLRVLCPREPGSARGIPYRMVILSTWVSV